MHFDQIPTSAMKIVSQGQLQHTIELLIMTLHCNDDHE